MVSGGLKIVASILMPFMKLENCRVHRALVGDFDGDGVKEIVAKRVLC